MRKFVQSSGDTDSLFGTNFLLYSLRFWGFQILTEKIYNQEKMQTKWPGQYGFGNDWWINRSKMRLNQSEITILNHPKITITTQEQHYNNNTQYYHPCFWCSSIGDLVTDSLTQWLLILTLQSDPRDLWPLWHLIRVMRRHDLTKKTADLHTYQP